MYSRLCVRTLRASPRDAVCSANKTAAFSSSSMQWARNDPATDLQDMVSPAKTTRPGSARPTPSTSPGNSMAASNPMLQGYPSAENPGRLSSSTASPDTTTPERGSAPTRSGSLSPPFRTSMPGAGSRRRPPPQNATDDLLSLFSNSKGNQDTPASPSFERRTPGGSRRIPQTSNFRTRVDEENEASGRRLGRVQANEAQRRNANKTMAALVRQAPRIWRAGDVYAPHDLSPVEQTKARSARQGLRSRFRMLTRARSRKQGGADAFDVLRLDPVKEYKNFNMMGEFVSEMGRIRGARETGLRAVNQRKLAKAVRRSIGMGLVPSVHRHPELFPTRREQRQKVWQRASRSEM